MKNEKNNVSLILCQKVVFKIRIKQFTAVDIVRVQSSTGYSVNQSLSYFL